MKRFLVASLFCASTIVNAQSTAQFVTVNKPIFCGPLSIILTSLAEKEVNEKPVWIGRSENSTSDIIVFVNFETSGFTIVEMGKEVGCIIGIGAKSNFLKPPSEQSQRLSINLSLHD